MKESEHNRNDRESIISGDSLSSDSESLHEESESSESFQEEPSFENILGVIGSLKKDDCDDPIEGKSPLDDENTKDIEAAEKEMPEKDANVESSPLMAQEEAKDGHDEAADAFETPSTPDGLGVDHPLMQSPERSRQKDRYDLLTMGVTTPKAFSALALNAEELPIVKSTPSIQNGNAVDQLHFSMAPCTYEELGYAAFGTAGRLAVLMSKSLYSFGCLIAYVVVVRDNFGLALRQMMTGPSSPNSLQGDDSQGILYDDDLLAFWVSAIVMLPLSCPRTMKPLAKFSFVSVLSIGFLVLVVVYLYFTCTNPEGGTTGKSSFYENWIEIRSLSGLIESLGCFVFTFMCHHTVNLAYETLPPQIRTPKVWRRVSTNSIALALQSSLAIGIFAYLTFGSQTPADVVSQFYRTWILCDSSIIKNSFNFYWRSSWDIRQTSHWQMLHGCCCA